MIDQKPPFFAPDTDLDESQILVYLRKSNKQAVKIIIPSPIELSILTGIIETQIGIPKEHLIIFHEGKTYPGEQEEDFDDTFLHIQNKNIIHIRDARKMKKGTINILIQVINADNTKGQAKLYSLDSETIIGEFLTHILYQNITQEEVFLFQSSRKLNFKASFYEESIEDEATVLLVIKETQFQDKILLQNYFEVRKKDLNYITETRDEVEFDTPQPNFKKKNKSVCMIPSLSFSSEVIRWELDANNDYDVSMDKLATSLKWKKVNVQTKEPDSKKQKLTSSGKSKLKEEFQRLFQWDGLGMDTQEDEKQCLNVFEEEEVENTEEFVFREGDRNGTALAEKYGTSL